MAPPAEPGSGRLLAVELTGLDPFHSRVRLELAPRLTVLVGKNGAGKSAILDGLLLGTEIATGRASGELSWRISQLTFKCEFEHEAATLAYEFTLVHERKTDSETPATVPKLNKLWRERCWDLSTDETVWEVRDAVARAGDATVNLQPGVGLLAMTVADDFPAQKTMAWLAATLSSVRRVQAGVPRTDETRNFSVQARDQDSGRFPVRRGDRIAAITATLLNWFERDKEKFDEFAAIGARMGVWKVVDPTVVKREEKGTRDLGLIDFDGVDVGQLSDGTLRVAEILRLLLSPSRLLLIEEPETSIHPGLLRRLLAEIATYSGARQTVLATHSPQVVTIADADELRLVYRVGGVTTARPLTAEQVSRVGDYLQDEGTLGDFVFGGGVEDEPQ